MKEKFNSLISTVIAIIAVACLLYPFTLGALIYALRWFIK